MLAIGLMSGTSLDGVDAALVNIDNDKFSLVDFYTLNYSLDFKEKLKRNLDNETAKLNEICTLNFEICDWFIKAIDELLKRNKLEYKDIKFIASHGQTIWHDPHGTPPSTLQIGAGSVISTKTNITTVSNFRCSDIACGGEGAPLVPGFEYLYFKNDQENICLQNIGGIGNVTYLKKNSSIDDVMAFDTGPGNCCIDYFVKKYFDKDYDCDGNIAKQGMVITNILNELISFSDYLDIVPPKSTGRELYSFKNLNDLSERLEFDKYDKYDIITTITEFTVYSIVYNYKKFIKDYDKVIVSGGGSHNKYIMDRLKEELGCVYTLDEIENSEIFSDAKEAFAFAILGYLTLNHLPGNVKSATGSKKSVILGDVSYGGNL